MHYALDNPGWPLESECFYILSKLKDLLDCIVTLVKLVLTKSFVIPIASSLFFKIEFSSDIHPPLIGISEVSCSCEDCGFCLHRGLV